MNAMSNPTPENLDHLKFYAVPATWLVKAWPILSARPSTMKSNHPTKDQVGKIFNAELVERGNVNEEEDDRKPAATTRSSVLMNGISGSTNFDQAKANMERFHLRRQMHKENATKMKSGLHHGRDYFFLGANVWELVKLKFGYDGYEICRISCKATTTPGNEEDQGIIAVALLPGEGVHAHANAIPASVESVAIPPTGRFPYEKIVPFLKVNENRDPALDPIAEDSRNGSNVVSSCGGEDANSI
jgi:hypothetical protein